MDVFGWLKTLFKRTTQSKNAPVNFEEVENAFGYRFKDRSLLVWCLKHRSYSQVVDGNVDLSNERMEFLGDSVLNMVVSHHLFIKNPDFQEGDLTKEKSVLVSKAAAAIAGRKLGIDRYMLLAVSEEESGGRNRDSIIADMYEAIIAAIFLDGGLEASQDFIFRTILTNKVSVMEEVQTNYKSLLLELSQEHRLGHPIYKTISEEGPDHDKVFTVEALIMDKSYGEGKGKSKKQAQQEAAKAGLQYLQDNINSEV